MTLPRLKGVGFGRWRRGYRVPAQRVGQSGPVENGASGIVIPLLGTARTDSLQGQLNTPDHVLQDLGANLAVVGIGSS